MSVLMASVQAELDFGLLKKCIQMETERSGCTRIRFTKPDKDGNVQQYLVNRIQEISDSRICQEWEALQKQTS